MPSSTPLEEPRQVGWHLPPASPHLGLWGTASSGEPLWSKTSPGLQGGQILGSARGGALALPGRETGTVTWSQEARALAPGGLGAEQTQGPQLVNSAAQGWAVARQLKLLLATHPCGSQLVPRCSASCPAPC